MAKDLFTEAEQQQIREAIQEAEKNTSGEIKVHIEGHCKEETLDRAAFVFEQLNMHKTKLRNGVLIYLAIKDKKFAILGDIGINQKVEKDFWNHISKQMINYFKEGHFVLGLTEGIKSSGKALSDHFPYKSDDKNELTDDISFGK